MRNFLAFCLALLLVCPALVLTAEANAQEMPAPADWRETVEAAMVAAFFSEEASFDAEEAEVDDAAQHRYDSKWEQGQVVLWQEVYGADNWAGYGFIFAARCKNDAELDTFSQRCRVATLAALGAAHPGLSAGEIETFLNALCPDYAEVAKSPAYIEHSASLGPMVYTVSGGGAWGFPSIQAFHSANTDAYLRDLQGTK